MPEVQNIQWFPGHMARTRRQIQASLKLVDAVVEVIDARIPLSSRNPELPSLTGHKPRIVLLNKCDAADKSVTNRWIDYYKSQGVPALAVDCRSGVGLNAFVPAVKDLLADKIEKAKLKGLPTSLPEALDALEADNDYLTAGGVFPEHLIKNFIANKRKECMQMAAIPHPAEFEKYFNL